MKRSLTDRGRLQPQKKPSTAESSRRLLDESVSTMLNYRNRSDAPDVNARHPHARDWAIDFDESNHTYKLNNDPVRISVTGLKKLFMPPFDKETAMKMKFTHSEVIGNQLVIRLSPKAKIPNPDAGKSRKEVNASWCSKRDRGTFAHAAIERFYLSLPSEDEHVNMTAAEKREMIIEQTPEMGNKENIGILNQFLKADHRILQLGWRLFRVEWKIYDETNNIAGSMDAVYRRPRAGTGEDEYLIVDWKCTGKKLNKCFAFNKFSRNAYEPFQGMLNSDIVAYTIQLNVYAYILRTCYGINVTSLIIVQLNPDESNVEGTGWCMHDIQNMHLKVEQMLKLWKEYLDFEKHIVSWLNQGEAASNWHPKPAYPCYIANRGDLEAQSSTSRLLVNSETEPDDIVDTVDCYDL